MKSKIIPLKQHHESGCGPTSIMMCARYFGSVLTEQEIEDACGQWKEEGMSNEELTAAFVRLGYEAKPSYNTSWEQLKKMSEDNDTVMVVSWMLRGYIGHFSIIEKVTKEEVLLVDPEIGSVVTMEKIQFLRMWFDYGEKWYPEVKDDFQLRWMVVVRK